MISGRDRARRFALGRLDGRIDVFAGDYVRLAGLLLVEGVSQLPALIFQGDQALGVFSHQDLGAAKGARAGRRDELVDLLVVVQAQVLSNDPRGLEREDPIQLLVGQ